ncbi:hypothetical protein L873DRAFT_1391420 [Choiromyces venosus 120613-1]|uniref:Cupredoxin n=1 Tax=Choiromyces venosus 120613-1 TaxID=1336337 RepID=A0A3N4J9J5_9PEZI|nr:hypothetical protein L873DRAFT_1391420 [Choiromyces venosus 120613-1]
MLPSSPVPAVHTTLPVNIVTATITVPCTTTTPMGAGAAAAATHIVTVGGTAGLVYTPPQISAAVGDLVHFIFMSNNHSVTQSTFAAPCNRPATGMDSDLRPNPNNTIVPAPFWAYTVTTTEPTWWYCKQRTGNHCGKGMVFAINPTAEKSFRMFLDTAIRINGTVSVPAAAGTATAALTPLPSVAAGTGSGSGDCKCQCFCPTTAYKRPAQITADPLSVHTTMQIITTTSPAPRVAGTNATTTLPSAISPSSTRPPSIPTALSLDTSSIPSPPPSRTINTSAPTALAAQTPSPPNTSTTPPPSVVSGYSSSLVLGLGAPRSTSFSQISVDFNTYSLGDLKSVLSLSIAPTPKP